MKKGNNLVKISGGLAIMFSVFLLLAISIQVTRNNEVYTRIINNNSKNQTAETSNKSVPSPDNNVVQGKFSLTDEGDTTQKTDDGTSYYYRTIFSEKLKNENVDPVLKLEIEENGQKKWKQISWSWIDTQEGSISFLFQTTKNGKTELKENYTGKYQIIF